MNYTTHISARLAAASALGAAAGSTLLGSLMLAHEQSSESTIVGIEHLTVAALSATCLMIVPVALFLGGLTGRPRRALVACTGLVLLAVLATISNVRGSDPSFFAAVAAPANLLWVGGLTALAVPLWRGRHVPRALAAGLPLTWALTIPLSLLGGGLLAAVYWLLIARAILPVPAGSRTRGATAAS